MRKQIISQDSHVVTQGTQDNPLDQENWLDLERVARVEVTSEDAAHPIESALILGMDVGWKATQPGKQTIRLVFDEPLTLRRIYLHFEETEQERTQEFVLRWSPDGGENNRELLRQQYNFSPPVTSREIEDFHVNLDTVTVLDLTIVPDISGGDACASLVRLRLA